MPPPGRLVQPLHPVERLAPADYRLEPRSQGDGQARSRGLLGRLLVYFIVQNWKDGHDESFCRFDGGGRLTGILG